MVAGCAVFQGPGCSILRDLGQGVVTALASHFSSPYSMPMEQGRCSSEDGNNGPADSAFGGISRANFLENEALPPALHLGLFPVQGRASG